MRIRYTPIVVFLLVFAACKKEEASAPSSTSGSSAPTAPSARELAMQDFIQSFGIASSSTTMNWTGSVANCDPGTVSENMRDLVLKRLNYYRRLVGLNDNCTWDNSQTAKFQQTALMMEANNMMDHYPPSSWGCYTALGAQGAAQSNLYMGLNGTTAIDGFMRDFGVESVGHRRWILHSTKTKFAYGATQHSTSLGVVSTAGGNTQVPEFIAYPPKGYMPRTIIPQYWSFSLPGANFSSAQVTMTGPDGNVPLNILHRNGGAGDKSIVWYPTATVHGNGPDVSFSVTVSGITNAAASSYTYTVISAYPY